MTKVHKPLLEITVKFAQGNRFFAYELNESTSFTKMNHIQRHLRATLRQKNFLGINYFSQNAATEINVADPKSEGNPILHRTLEFCPKHLVPRQVWVESLDDIKENKKGLVELHPKIFGCLPRLDLIFENVEWQLKFRDVVLYSAKSRAEMRGGGRKPHPQKGLGRARQGSIRAPQYFCGGVAHGPRSPTSYFYMLRFYKRIHGLTSTLSAKFAQDDLHVVENLEIPTEDRQYMLDLIKERNWGPSVLLVDSDDIMPRNITVATDTIGHVNLMPVYGLNVFGMLKHDTLVLTLSAVDEIEKKITKLLNAANEKELIEEFQKYHR